MDLYSLLNYREKKMMSAPDSCYKINTILIIDDEIDICTNLKAFFEDEGYQVFVANDGRQGLELFARQRPDLVILDLHMPHLSGHDLLTELARKAPHIPKLIISGVGNVNEVMQAIHSGGWDLLSKPINDFGLLLHKIGLMEEKAALLQQNKHYKKYLDHILEQRIVALQSSELKIMEAQREIVSRLSDVIEMRSRETGNHVRRVAQIAHYLALAYGLSAAEADMIRLAAPLHDIGKAGIPDAILMKNGKLVDDEFEIIKTHTTIGHEMLMNSDQPIIQAGAIIALQHHEHWDGSGYPHGLAGEQIHIYGRITCLADIYDVLLQKRQHKESWHAERARNYVQMHSGTFFDPHLAQLFLQNIDSISDIILDSAESG